MISLAVTYVLKPGREEEMLAVFAKLAAATRAEPGCRMYVMQRSTSEPLRYLLYEQYDDQAALDAHRAAPHFEQYAKNGLFPLLESRSPELYEMLEL